MVLNHTKCNDVRLRNAYEFCLLPCRFQTHIERFHQSFAGRISNQTVRRKSDIKCGYIESSIWHKTFDITFETGSFTWNTWMPFWNISAQLHRPSAFKIDAWNSNETQLTIFDCQQANRNAFSTLFPAGRYGFYALFSNCSIHFISGNDKLTIYVWFMHACLTLSACVRVMCSWKAVQRRPQLTVCRVCRAVVHGKFNAKVLWMRRNKQILRDGNCHTRHASKPQWKKKQMNNIFHPGCWCETSFNQLWQLGNTGSSKEIEMPGYVCVGPNGCAHNFSTRHKHVLIFRCLTSAVVLSLCL